ncbi:MAG: hypothetical protein ACRD9L_01760 [Bryobacteraceae bacterium]
MFVDGQRFLILGVQWDLTDCFSPEIMDPLFPEAVKMGDRDGKNARVFPGAAPDSATTC